MSLQNTTTWACPRYHTTYHIISYHTISTDPFRGERNILRVSLFFFFILSAFFFFPFLFGFFVFILSWDPLFTPCFFFLHASLCITVFFLFSNNWYHSFSHTILKTKPPFSFALLQSWERFAWRLCPLHEAQLHHNYVVLPSLSLLRMNFFGCLRISFGSSSVGFSRGIRVCLST